MQYILNVITIEQEELERDYICKKMSDQFDYKSTLSIKQNKYKTELHLDILQ